MKKLFDVHVKRGIFRIISNHYMRSDLKVKSKLQNRQVKVCLKRENVSTFRKIKGSN